MSTNIGNKFPTSTGTQRGFTTKIDIEEYNENWVNIYKDEKANILADIELYIEDIQHIGSTAIPSLAAKPTIDICIGVKSLDVADKYMIRNLELKGYDYLQFLEEQIPQRRYLQKLDDTEKHLFHIHIVVKDGILWNEHINFRNYLINHPSIARKYEELKISLKAKYSDDRKSYTEGKTEFIRNIVAKTNVIRQDKLTQYMPQNSKGNKKAG